MVARKEVSPELEASARHLYEQTLAPVEDIGAMLGLSKSTFYKRVKAWNWARRRASAAHFEFARAFTTAAAVEQAKAQLPEADVAPADNAPSAAAPVVDRNALAARLLELVGHEMELIDKVFKSVGEIAPDASDRTSRTIANLGRSLHEIHEFLKPPTETNENQRDDADDDAVPLDIDEFRYELARRINEFVDARRSRASGTGDPSLGRDDADEA